MTATKTGKPVNAVDFLMEKYVNGRPDQELLLCEEAENARIAEAVYNMREEAGLSQADLAKRIGTQKSAISRLEDADYQGHSLGMLKRIAEVLGYRVDLTFQKVRSHTGKAGVTPARDQASRRIPERSRLTGNKPASGRWVSRAAAAPPKAMIACKGVPRSQPKPAKKK